PFPSLSLPSFFAFRLSLFLSFHLFFFPFPFFPFPSILSLLFLLLSFLFISFFLPISSFFPFPSIDFFHSSFSLHWLSQVLKSSDEAGDGRGGKAGDGRRGTAVVRGEAAGARQSGARGATGARGEAAGARQLGARGEAAGEVPLGFWRIKAAASSALAKMEAAARVWGEWVCLRSQRSVQCHLMGHPRGGGQHGQKSCQGSKHRPKSKFASHSRLSM
ncbi:unnamed protein product, partial [Linum tenue]